MQNNTSTSYGHRNEESLLRVTCIFEARNSEFSRVLINKEGQSKDFFEDIAWNDTFQI